MFKKKNEFLHIWKNSSTHRFLATQVWNLLSVSREMIAVVQTHKLPNGQIFSLMIVSLYLDIGDYKLSFFFYNFLSQQVFKVFT